MRTKKDGGDMAHLRCQPDWNHIGGTLLGEGFQRGLISKTHLQSVQHVPVGWGLRINTKEQEKQGAEH